jgi:hypothetical protein
MFFFYLREKKIMFIALLTAPMGHSTLVNRACYSGG